MVGTYELFVNFETGFVDSGQLFLNADTSWSLGNFIDGGSYHSIGQAPRSVAVFAPPPAPVPPGAV
jgi:hypothetical protein